MHSVLDQDFVSSLALEPPPEPEPYIVSGILNPVSTNALNRGTHLVLVGSAPAITINSNSDGTFQFSGISNGTYILFASYPGMTMVPANQTVIVNDGNVTDIVISVLGGWNITGTVRAGGVGLAGVTVNYVGPISGQYITPSAGNYSFPGMPVGIYIVTPSLSGYTFNPPSRTITLSTGSVTAQDFVATAV